MLLAELRQEVLDANLDLVRRGLVLSTFGNASGVDRSKGLLVIKPSGVPYEAMKPADLVVTDLDGKVVEGTMRPSSDLPTHAALYRAFSEIGGIAHTHSEYATAWAQARKPIPCFGTTHADYFHGAIPLTEPMTREEIDGEYEANTGELIIRAVKAGGHDVMAIPAMLVANHGPFAWGESAQKAAENAWMLEAAARIAYLTVNIHPHASGVEKALHDRHFLRKHGKKAYYGQDQSKH
ncbi:MAG: L-ribulose-5-phosphate 4-epimerase AraD [Candidatus Acidiferrales bacterium]